MGAPQLPVRRRHVVRRVHQRLPLVAECLRKQVRHQDGERWVLARDRLVHAQHLVGAARLAVVAYSARPRAVLLDALVDHEALERPPLAPAQLGVDLLLCEGARSHRGLLRPRRRGDLLTRRPRDVVEGLSLLSVDRRSLGLTGQRPLDGRDLALVGELARAHRRRLLHLAEYARVFVVAHAGEADYLAERVADVRPAARQHAGREGRYLRWGCARSH